VDKNSMRAIFYILFAVALSVLVWSVGVAVTYAGGGRTVATSQAESSALKAAESDFLSIRQLIEISTTSRIPASSPMHLKGQILQKQLLDHLTQAREDAKKSNDPTLIHSYNQLVNECWFWQQGYPYRPIFNNLNQYKGFLI
ncbi:MAG TPA: hypothetical protein VJL87_01600, partial [Bdellovibrionota bacterium]|nr:hypothetical protein [Bdellovibrionota bacterium]